jgi:hypothetical protein
MKKIFSILIVFTLLATLLCLTACESLNAGEPIQGAAGKSAYELWIDEGNSGSVQDFLDSLKGAQGDNGLNAYQIMILITYK